MILVILPVSLVLGSLNEVIDPIAVSLAVLELTLIDITVCIYESSSSIRLVEFEIAFIDRSTTCDLKTLALSQLCSDIPFTFIFETIGQQFHRSLLNIRVVFLFWFTTDLETEWRQSQSNVFNP